MMMDKNTDRQFDAADAATEKAVTAFMGKIEQLLGRWEAVSPAYIVERTLLALCDDVAKLVDKDHPTAGPATIKLSNALADFRDSLAVER
jgi:hypothetical protein